MGVSLLSACSTSVIEMSDEPTEQVFDLSDNEGDGIIAARDNCPESRTGAEVNNSGCDTEKVVKIRRKLIVNFPTDSVVVDPKYYSEIQGLSEFMKEYPAVSVTIEGHTSIRGSAVYNKQLSLRRSEAIKALLVSRFGIEAERVKAVGFGFEQLLLEGSDEYVHAKNRRIVAEISSDKKIIDMKWTIYTVDQREE